MDVEPCAACRHQRRKCTEVCILRPYFPNNTHQRQFQNAYKLFGVGNIKKIISNLDDQRQRDTAIQTIIYESEARAQYPVEGCYGILRQLRQQIQTAYAELQNVSNQLALYRPQQNNNYQNVLGYLDFDFDNLDLDNLDLGNLGL